MADPGGPARILSAAGRGAHRRPRGPLGGGRGTRQAPAFLALSALAQLLTFVFTVVAAHLVDPARYGEVMALFAAFALVALPTTALQVVAARHLATAPRRVAEGGRARGFRAQVHHAFATGLPATSLAIALALLVAARWARLPALPLAVLGVLAWNGGTLLAWWRAPLQADRRFARLGAALVLETLARLLLFVLLVAVGGMSASWAWVAAAAGAILAAGAVLRGHAASLDADPIVADQAWRSARAALLATIAGGVLTSLDLLWGRATLPATEAGHFAAGTLASRPMLLIASVAGTIALPSVATGRLRAPGLVRAAAGLGAVGLVVAAVLWALAPTLTRMLYPASFAGTVPAFRAAAVGSVGVAAALFLANGALGLARPRGQGALALIVVGLGAAVFLWARTPAAYWGYAGAAGALHLVTVAALGRTRSARS